MGFLLLLTLVFAAIGVIRGVVWVFHTNWSIYIKLLVLSVFSVFGMNLLNGITHPHQLPGGVDEVTALVAAVGVVITAGWGIRQSGNRRWAHVFISLGTLGMLAFLVMQIKQGVERSSHAARNSFESTMSSGASSKDSGSTTFDGGNLNCDALSPASRRVYNCP